MNETLVLKLIAGAFLSAAFALNVKIVWDWLTKGKKNEFYRVKCDIESVEKRFSNSIEKINLELSSIVTKVSSLHKVVVGNGKPQESVLFKLATIEEFMKEVKKIKESRGL